MKGVEQDETFNLYVYHAVFANSIAAIYNMIKEKDFDSARTIMILNYYYANTITKRKKVEKGELERMDLYDLFSLMADELITAELGPTQKQAFQPFLTKLFDRLKKEKQQ